MAEERYPVLAIDRLRMTTDGTGVTTLVCSMGCPLRCRLCINPESWNGAKPVGYCTVDELYEKVKKDSLYFVATGGGLTFGGGEPLLQSKFLKAFMEKYKSLGWTFNLESSLNVPRENLDDVLPFIEEFIIDTKDMDPVRYHEYTGGDYDRFYQNLLYLKENVPVERIRLRIPLIPHFHKGHEPEESVEKLKELGFTYLERFTYKDVTEEKKS